MYKVHDNVVHSEAVRLCPPQQTGFIVSVRRLIYITLFDLVQLLLKEVAEQYCLRLHHRKPSFLDQFR